MEGEFFAGRGRAADCIGTTVRVWRRCGLLSIYFRHPLVYLVARYATFYGPSTWHCYLGHSKKLLVEIID